MVSGGGVNWSMVSTVVFSSKVGETFALWVVALYFLLETIYITVLIRTKKHYSCKKAWRNINNLLSKLVLQSSMRSYFSKFSLTMGLNT